MEIETGINSKVKNSQIGVDPFKNVTQSKFFRHTKQLRYQHTVDVDASDTSVTPEVEVESLEDLELQLENID